MGVNNCSDTCNYVRHCLYWCHSTFVFRGETITVQQLQEALGALKGTSGDAKFRSLISVLDEDHDGNMNLDEIAEVCPYLYNMYIVLYVSCACVCVCVCVCVLCMYRCIVHISCALVMWMV